MTWTAFAILAMFLVISNKVQTRFTKHGVTWLWSHSEIDIPLVSSRKSKPHCQSQEDIWRKSVINKSLKKIPKRQNLDPFGLRSLPARQPFGFPPLTPQGLKTGAVPGACERWSRAETQTVKTFRSTEYHAQKLSRQSG